MDRRQRAEPRWRTTEWEELARWSWVVLPAWGRLHHLAVLDDAERTQREWAGDGRVSCGRRGSLALPGLFSRSRHGGLPRCQRCCVVSGYPQGTGSPKNDAALRPLVEAELKA